MAPHQSQNSELSRNLSSYRVHDMPSRQRPREEMARLGAEHVSDHGPNALLLAPHRTSGHQAYAVSSTPFCPR